MSSAPETAMVWVPGSAARASPLITVTGADPLVSTVLENVAGPFQMVRWATPRPMPARAVTNSTMATTKRNGTPLGPRCGSWPPKRGAPASPARIASVGCRTPVEDT
ncbi:MAG: hypothetical protein J0G30_12255 [Actinomycetales bacterium]|nr:hypothetical protein [Actinomycetales bacterium]